MDLRNAYSYITDSRLYNGDARCVASGNSADEYYWKHPGISSSTPTYFKIHVRTYLNHLSFTDPSATYYVEYFRNVYYPVGSLNQNNAPAGWTEIISKDVKTLFTNGGYWSSDAYIEPSGKSGYNTGADAIQVVYIREEQNCRLNFRRRKKQRKGEE